MRAVFGLLLTMLGLAMAVVWMPAHDAERQLAVVTDIATQGLSRSTEGRERLARTFASSTPLLAIVEPPGQEFGVQVSGDRVGATVSSAAFLIDGGVARTSMSASVVAGAVMGPAEGERSVSLVYARGSDGGGQLRPAAEVELSRDELVRGLQRELKRVGCYTGLIDGNWGPGSRRAMSGFTDRMNATLPTSKPDFILLTLLQGHQGTVCGRQCPAGQALTESGRCVPTAVLAHARLHQEPRLPSAVSPRPSEPNGWSTGYTTVPAVTTSTGVTAGAIAAIVTGTTASSARLPGRMGVGGPVSSSLDSLTGPATAGREMEAGSSEASGQSARAVTVARRERSRRRSVRNPTRRYHSIQGPPAVVYRAPRVAAQRSYARRSSGAWTATFFRTN